MTFTELPLKGAYVVEPVIREDERGFFFRYFCKDEFAAIGHTGEWVQMNHSYTIQKGSVRGLHYQLPPFSEIKFLRCISGRIYDVIVDIRQHSPTFLQWTGIELSAANRKMLYIPEGFAHGFQTLEDHCELIYHHSAYYTPGAEGGLRFSDPVLGIQWPLQPTSVSDRDLQHPLLTKQFQGIKL